MSARVRRFFYVRPPNRAGVRHIMFGNTHSEGRAACGTFVRKGWRWVKSENNLGFVPTCKRCEKAAFKQANILVERVRQAA